MSALDHLGHEGGGGVLRQLMIWTSKAPSTSIALGATFQPPAKNWALARITAKASDSIVRRSVMTLTFALGNPGSRATNASGYRAAPSRRPRDIAVWTAAAPPRSERR